jgi:hypothetical protein
MKKLTATTSKIVPKAATEFMFQLSFSLIGKFFCVMDRIQNNLRLMGGFQRVSGRILELVS